MAGINKRTANHETLHQIVTGCRLYNCKVWAKVLVVSDTFCYPLTACWGDGVLFQCDLGGTWRGARDHPLEPIVGNSYTVSCQHTVIEIEKIIAEDSFVSYGSNISVPL